ncbi:uncharacterized protein IWZ02DRAFT_255256 [Phyllosticta citriasiana]|uniref:uncharacterized protein n=1 Tax=Phyllosticta citriasiana TaxID=595635 RepID=UPI0030FD3613
MLQNPCDCVLLSFTYTYTCIVLSYILTLLPYYSYDDRSSACVPNQTHGLPSRASRAPARNPVNTIRSATKCPADLVVGRSFEQSMSAGMYEVTKSGEIESSRRLLFDFLREVGSGQLCPRPREKNQERKRTDAEKVGEDSEDKTRMVRSMCRASVTSVREHCALNRRVGTSPVDQTGPDCSSLHAR